MRPVVFLYILGAVFVVAGAIITYALHSALIGAGFFLIGAWLFLMPSLRRRRA